ncbi:MAG: recombination protein NinB [Peptostreptococcaceae bacterium]|nr:recombination protein NinB [Peptostreptococcaceae bacterium]MDY5738666.1 recombination protein NinB [Anaerovoracaceae bacterium]
MKINEVRLDLLYKQDNIVIALPKGQHQEALKIVEEAKIKPDKDYSISIKPIRKRRSLDANAYFWILCKKLSEKLNQKETDVYKNLVREVGAYTLMLVQSVAVERLKMDWESRGIGWICIDMGKSKTDENCSVIRCYYGSSSYKTDEMSRLIDAVIDDCKEQGIETLPPDEIERLKANWK